MLKLIKRFSSDENGATAIEYGLIAGLIGVSVVSGATLIGDGIVDIFGEIEEAIPDSAEAED
ncbi:MAG: Flp family type IVb pilin [Lentilitoribacter sp.]